MNRNRWLTAIGIYLLVTFVLWLMAWTMGFRGGPGEMLVGAGKSAWANTGDGVFNFFWNFLLLIIFAVLIPGIYFWGIAGIVILVPLAIFSAVVGVMVTSAFGTGLLILTVVLLSWGLMKFIKSLEPFKRT